MHKIREELLQALLFVFYSSLVRGGCLVLEKSLGQSIEALDATVA